MAAGLTSSNATIEILYYVYAIWSESHDKIYVGFTENPNKRLRYHNSGRSKYTKRYKPWIRFHLEEVETKAEALKKENEELKRRLEENETK